MFPEVVIRPILLLATPHPEPSLNQSAPSDPAVVSPAAADGTSLLLGVVVIGRILAAAPSVNQSAPSGPAVIPKGLAAWGSGNSLMLPEVVIRPILFRLNSVNQSAPSDPAVIPRGSAKNVGIGNSLKLPGV